MSYGVMVRLIMLYFISMDYRYGSGEWPLQQSTNCMYFNVARIVFLTFMCIGY